jgi:hypothetical protein
MGMGIDPFMMQQLQQAMMAKQLMGGMGSGLLSSGMGGVSGVAPGAGAMLGKAAGAGGMMMPILQGLGMGFSALGSIEQARQQRKEAAKQRSLQGYGMASQEGANNSAALQALMQILLAHSGRGM